MENKQKEKIYYGDYQLLGELLDASSSAARMRFKRGDPEADKAMKAIQENRKHLIESYKNSTVVD